MPLSDIISRLREAQGNLNKSEQKVLAVVLADLEFASTATNKAIAQKADVSEPTLTRFCKRLGCKNFLDFKIKLSRNLAIGKQYFLENDVNKKNFVIFDVFRFAIDSLQKTALQLDMEKVMKTVSAIKTAKKVVIMGIGGQSSSLATIAENRFFRLGITSRAYCDDYVQRMAASVLNKQDVLLAISASGKIKNLLECVSIAKEYQAQTISITKKNTPLSQSTDVSIELDLEEDNNNYKPSSSRYGFLAVIDTIAMGVAIESKSTSLEYLRRIRSNLFSGEFSNNVIGD